MCTFFKKNVVIKLCFVFYLCTPILCNSHIQIILKGLDSELEYSVRRQFFDINFDVIQINPDFQKKLRDAIIIGLKSLGYYEPKIHLSHRLISKENKKSNILIVTVDPGQPVRIIKIDIQLFGEGRNDCDYKQILKDSDFFLGKSLNHSDYEQLKKRLYSLALCKGYFDAKFQNSQLVVIPSLQQCIWKINFDSGKRYIFDEIKFQNSQIKESYLKNISNIHSGECYHVKSIVELNRRLSSTNWFESIATSSDIIISDQKKN